jgi:hypothetical protein
MQNELLETLVRFHRDVLLPDVKREFGGLREELVARFDGLNPHFDSIYARFGRLETEYQALTASVARIETRLDSVDTSVTLIQRSPNRDEAGAR